MTVDTLNAQTTNMEATLGDDNFKVVGDEKCFYLEFGDSYGVYGVANPADLDNSEGIIISIAGVPKVGTFKYQKLKKGRMVEYGTYYTNDKRRLTSTDNGESGSITISKVEGNLISGSFEYLALDTDGSEVPVKGLFTVKKME